MSIPYTGFYIYPPRTKSTFPYDGNTTLRMWKRFDDAICQYKMNGNRNLVKVSPDRKVEFWNRHNARQPKTGYTKTNYEPPEAMLKAILEISPPGHWTVWDTELLDGRTKTVKNILYFFDVLVWESSYLVGTNYGERFKLVERILHGRPNGTPELPLDFNMIDRADGIYIAHNIPPSEWDNAWSLAQSSDHCEGLVYKRTGNISRLVAAVSSTGESWNNGGFMAKCRKPTKNYRQ